MLTPARIALIYCIFAAMWIMVSDYVVTFSVQDPITLGRLELFKGLLFVFSTSALLYLLLQTWGIAESRKTAMANAMMPVKATGIVLLFLILVLTVPLLGFAVTKLYGPYIEGHARASLEVVAKLKTERIERWMSARNADSRLLAANTPVFAHAAGLAVQASSAAAHDAVLDGLKELKEKEHYKTFLLLDLDMSVLVAEGDQRDLSPELTEAVQHSLATRQIERTNLYRDTQNIPHLDWVVPIRTSALGGDRMTAMLVLRADPEQFLRPLVQTWPSPSASAEAMLVRRDGERILYLSELRHREAMQPDMLASQPHLLAALALKSVSPGSANGVDYRDQRVLSAYRPVADSDWRVIAKISRDEVLQPLWNMVLIISAIAFVFVIVISLVLLFLWRQQLRLQGLLTLAHKVKSERMQQQFFSMSFVGMAVVSPCGKKFEQFNEYLCEMLGYRHDELAGKSCLDFTYPDDIETDMQALAKVLDGHSSGYVMEKRFLHKNGSIVHAMVDTKCIHQPDGTVDHLFVTVQDISSHKAAEVRIHRLTQIYAALSQCNQSIVRCTSEQELFDRICETAVTYGGMKMAWIGMINQRKSLVEPVSCYGDDIGYLDDIVISIDSAHPCGNGPVARAVRDNQAYWSQDFFNDQVTAPWQSRSKGTFGSSAAVPVTKRGAVVGTLCMYSVDTNAFDDEAKNLLIEMAADISFALNNFDKEARRIRVETQLTESESKFHLLFDQSLDGLLIVDGNEIVECNPAALSMMGCRLEHILNTPVWAFSPLRQPDGVLSEEKMQLVLQSAKAQGRHRFEWIHRRLSGEDFPVEVTMVAITLNGKEVFYTTWRDISEQKNAEARIRHLAQYDVLTGLPNRTLLADRVTQAINIAQRNQNNLTVMFFDLDRFKNVNDSLGHSVGDELLIQVAKRLQTLVREQDTVSRLGGDEFVILLPDTNMDGASRVAEKITNTVTQLYHIKQHELAITSSIGIAVYPDDGDNFNDLLKSADIAMYRAKQDGRNNYHFFTAKMQEDSVRIMQLEAALHHAIDLDQLSLNFQPQYSLHHDTIVGAEVLLRWQHPEFGWVSPAEFIPIAEDTGDILRIGEWVLQQSIRQLKEWHTRGMHTIKVAVNLSAVQFKHPRLPDTIKKLLNDANLQATYLELELTESASMNDPLTAVAMMDKLAELGIRMSIDDFGTGYSSLSYLKRFKAYQLKIDQSFVRDIMSDTDDRAIVSSIISMAKGLGMNTIAEGVETREQLDFLRAAGCDEIQGYYFSRPLTADAFEAFYKTRATI